MESDSTHATITTVATRKTLKGIEYIDKGKLVNKMHTVYAVVADLLRKQQETMEKQHQLMERLVSVALQSNPLLSDTFSEQPKAVAASGFEVIMKNFSKSFREFCYDPGEIQIVELWYEQLHDAAKFRLLLRKVSTTVFEKYISKKHLTLRKWRS